MGKLNDLLHELGISKVKLAKFLGVSRQMIYNYLELDDLNKWPKDKKVLLLNLLGIKSPDDLKNIKIDTDYILDVETRLNSLIENSQEKKVTINGEKQVFNHLGKKQKDLLINIVDLIKERLEDSNDMDAYYTFKYMYNFMQSLDNIEELKYVLGYFAKVAGFVKPMEFMFNEEKQFVFESIMYSGMALYANGKTSNDKIAEAHKRFVNQIEHKMEEKMSRTLEINTIKVQALKELGYTTINENNFTEVLEKITEIESRKIKNHA
jgi:predicted transcriptional regulator